MTASIAKMALAASLLASAAAFAQAPSAAPSGSTGQCKDGSYTSAASKQGACRGHKGVQDWFAAGAAAAPAKPSAAARAQATAAPAAAAVPLATAPAAAAGRQPGSTGLCKDGSYTSAASKQGACRGHKGVQDWYAAAAAPAAARAPVAVPAPVAAPAAASVAAAPVAVPAAAPAAAPAVRTMPAMPAQAAPGGGPGMVWANASTKVYHCSNDKWYGKTKNGSYMSEADAKAKGFHADHGKACQ